MRKISILTVLSLTCLTLASSDHHHVNTQEEEKCAMFALHKMASEADPVFRKRLSQALKILQTGDVDKVFELIEKQPQSIKDKMFNEYLVEDCFIMRKYFIPPGQEAIPQ